jgi:hypothetical protein
MRTQALRRLRIAGLIIVAVTATGCSHVTGSKSSKDGKPVPCTFIANLDQIANTVATADVHKVERSGPGDGGPAPRPAPVAAGGGAGGSAGYDEYGEEPF